MAAALVGAFGVLWSKIFLPGFKAANRADKLIDTVTRVEAMMPALAALVAQLGEATDLLPVVKQIAAEFKSDSGSTLKDQLNEHDKLLAKLGEALHRIEIGDLLVAKNLSVAQQAVDDVATALDSSRSRADVVGPGHIPGTASDAASRHDPNDPRRGG